MPDEGLMNTTERVARLFKRTPVMNLKPASELYVSSSPYCYYTEVLNWSPTITAIIDHAITGCDLWNP